MNRTPVKSSNVKSIGYDPDKKILEVEFANGDVYRYLKVPENVHYSLMTSPSIGAAMHTLIRGKFKFEKVSE